MTNLLKRIRRDGVPWSLSLVLTIGLIGAVAIPGGASAEDDNYVGEIVTELTAEEEGRISAQVGEVPDIGQRTGVGEGEEVTEEILVTGSRIRRDEYTTAAPLQTYDVQQAKQIGITNVTELLQRTTIAGGRQINGTVNRGSGFTNATEPPPPGGMGSANLSLRGLDAERTLILINGKRIGPASAGGAPAQPDINLLPLNLVENVEVITEGASAVYGADAVAGVVNVLLRDDFEGMEITANAEFPFDGGGEVRNFSMIAGTGNDRGNIVFAAEYFERQTLQVGDRRDCIESLPADPETGETLDQFVNCIGRLPDAQLFFSDAIPLAGIPGISAQFRRGLSAAESDMGFANFASPCTLPLPPAPRVDETSSCGTRDNFDLQHDFLFTDTEERLEADLVQPITRFSIATLGSYRPDWLDNSMEFYYEAYHLHRHGQARGNALQIFPTFPGLIPVDNGEGSCVQNPDGSCVLVDNPINPVPIVLGNVITGFDAGGNPILGPTQFLGDTNAAPGDQVGNLVLSQPLGLPPEFGTILPVLTLPDSFPQLRTVEVNQTRIVGGIRGDIPTGWFEQRNWAYDISVSYDRAVGSSANPIIVEDRLREGIETIRVAPGILSEAAIFDAINPLGQSAVDTSNLTVNDLTCGDRLPFNDNAPLAFPLLTPRDCVIFDVFGNDFAMFDGGPRGDGILTPEQEEFFLGTRTSRSVVEQGVFSAFLTGELFDIPTGGTVATAFGVEWRRDSIRGEVDTLGATGGNAAEAPATEGATIGARELIEFYGEVAIPVITGREYVDYLGVEAAVRYTDETNFGDEVTERFRLTYRPVDWIQVSGSYGTSFRAPNLRESFLANQFSGIGGAADPCTIPARALDGTTYLPDEDPRNPASPVFDPDNQFVFENCELSGADPTQLGRGALVTIDTITGGNTDDLRPETSDAFTATLQVEPPISDAFDLNIAISFFDIKVNDTVVQIDAAEIMSRCFLDAPNLSSPFCNRVGPRRDTGLTSNLPLFVDTSFINVGKETSQGIDVNTQFRTQFSGVGSEPVNLIWATAWSIQTERTEQVFSDSPVMQLDGTYGIPKHRFTSDMVLTRGNWDLNLATRFLGETEPTQADLDQNDCDIPSGSPDTLPGDIFTVCTVTAKRAWYQDVSLTYSLPMISFTAGINNVFDKKPPLISLTAGQNRANLPVGIGYDQFGRSVFFTATASF